MKINKVIINNFKCYVGSKEFDFISDRNINVILAQNGNGKTSFLEAVLLGFFGCKMFNSDHYTKDYIEFVVSRLSRTANDNKINITIEYEDEGVVYKLVRSYEVSKTEITYEEFEIFKGEEEVESSRFLEKYDYSIVKRLFLDGEHIINVINDGEVNNFASNFISTVFNLRVLEQIKGDLNKIERDSIKAMQSGEHKSLENSVYNIEQDLENLNKNISKNESLISTSKQNVKSIELQMKKRSIENDEELDKLIKKNEQLSNDNSKLNLEVKNFVNNDLQYLMHKRLLEKYVDQLEATRKDRLKEMETFMESISSLDVPTNYIDLKLEKEYVEKKKLVLEVSINDIESKLASIKRNSNKYDKNRDRIACTNKGKMELDILSDYKQKSIDIEKLEKKNEMLSKEKERQENLLEEKQRKLDKLNADLMGKRISNNLVDEKSKLKKVIDRYISIKSSDYNDNIANRSFEILQNYFLRKGELVDRITFEDSILRVYKDDREVNYNNFSAGEKQMLVVSLMFAIIEESKVKLPLVLDSFVGRLDNKHTENILRYLSDNVDNQIIIVSTDNEIDDKRLDYMKDSLGKCYELHNDGFSTTISEVTI